MSPEPKQIGAGEETLYDKPKSAADQRSAEIWFDRVRNDKAGLFRELGIREVNGTITPSELFYDKRKILFSDNYLFWKNGM